MEGEGVDLVLSRAVELRLKISNCIHKATANGESVKEGLEEGKDLMEVNPNSLSHDEGLQNEAEEEDDDEDAERLLHIRDALESLEHQLSNLQALQEQQRYEREVALSEIEHSRKILLQKLKEYKGADLEVIREASTFVAETVEHSNDLLLPPYPSRPPPSLVLDNHFLSHKYTRNGSTTQPPSTNPPDNPSGSSRNGLGKFIGTITKTLVTVVGIISVLSLSGFGTKRLKKLEFFREPESEGERRFECPPGRVLVTENGEARCVVKERVAIPFEAVVSKPDLDYGCG